MSSQASLRCLERRKSAGARLQSASQCDPLSKDSGYGPHNSEKEATAQQRPMSGIPELHTRVPRRRVKSALESRREQEASHIFQGQGKEKVAASVDPQWGTTKYLEDFGPKKRGTPVPMRPASSTRRNNPHPSNVSDCLSWDCPHCICMQKSPTHLS